MELRSRSRGHLEPTTPTTPRRSSSSRTPSRKGSMSDSDTPQTPRGFRKLTRPVNEFGGNIGCVFWMIVIPTAIYYSYGCLVLNHGEFVMPSMQMVHDMWNLPDGLSIRPTWFGFRTLAIWVALCAFLEIVVPGPLVEGVVLKNGRRLLYPMNGLTCFFMINTILILLVNLGAIEPYIVYKNMGAFLSCGVVTAFVMALWLYIDFGLLWRRHIDDEEFEEDWGVFDVKDCFHDYFLGVTRNPRLFRSFLKVPFDLKRFWNARPGLTMWVMANWSIFMAQYYGCHIVQKEDKTFDLPKCNAVGSLSNVSWAMWLICVSHYMYIVDYNWNEPAYLTTTDIRHDHLGWMLCYGDWGFLPWLYSMSFSLFIANLKTPLDNTPRVIAVACITFACQVAFRLINSQKHEFRSHIATTGSPEGHIIWGKPAKYMVTKEGSVLLLSGFWGIGRHLNYLPDLVMAASWVFACSGSVFPLAPLGYMIYFWMMDIHRLFRDEGRMRQKYGADFDRFVEHVPYRIIPYIF